MHLDNLISRQRKIFLENLLTFVMTKCIFVITKRRCDIDCQIRPPGI